MTPTNVLLFPDPMHREWLVFREHLLTLYRRHGSDAVECEYVLKRVQSTFLQYGRGLEINAANVEQALEQVNAWILRMVGGALADLMLREIELYRLRGEGAA